MNERIFELAKQADLIQWDTLSSGARTPDHESVVKARKFAELIVNECVRVMYDNAIERKVPPDIDKTPLQYAIAIKEHFGVEE
jgi:hypothetical protein